MTAATYHADRFAAAMTAARKAARKSSDAAIAAELDPTPENIAAAAAAAAEHETAAERATAAEFRMRAADRIAAAADRGEYTYIAEDLRPDRDARIAPRVVHGTNGKAVARRYMPRHASHNDALVRRANPTTLGAFLRERAGI